MTPRVTVVIPCHGDGAVVGEAIASVREEEPVDIVVVDDASPDAATREVVRGLGEHGARTVMLAENVGLGPARMRGVAEATTFYVFPLDADDLAVPGMLARMANRLDAAPDAGVCYGDWEEFGTHEQHVPVPPRIDPYRLAYNGEYPPLALFRRSVLLETGGWAAPLPLRVYEDWHLWMSLAERGIPGVYMGPGVVTYRRRLHGERLLHHARAHHRTYYRTLKRLHPALFARRREARRSTDLSRVRRLLYPVLYGARPRFRFEPALRRGLRRRGLWW